MRLLICYSSYTGRAHGVHRHGVDERNVARANVSDNNAKCADAQYPDGRGRADDMVRQTHHSYIHCAVVAHSYNHTDYNRVAYNTADSLHSYDGRGRYSIHRGHGHVHGRDSVLVVSNQNEYSNQCFLLWHFRCKAYSC